MPDSHLSRYVGPTEVTKKNGKIYLFDAGTDEIIAELTPEAADAVRKRKPTKIDTWEHDILTMED
jgi:hypothetical protein